MYKITLKINGMSCSMCEAHVNDAIRNKLDIKKIKTNHKKGSSEIISERIITLDELNESLKDSGYIIEDYKCEEYKKKALFG